MNHFYIKPHTRSVAGTINAYLPPGHPDPYKKGDRDVFIEGEKSRKYNSWDAMGQEVRVDEQARKIQTKNNSYVIDKSESY